MKKLFRAAALAVALPGLALALGMEASAATCVNKAGQGTNNTKDGAMFQAWEAVLQATDWGSWASFMASGMKVGSAPGYQVKGLRSSCKAGGIGQECVVQATLCK